jgi:lipopolysaccharide transport system ATP-binding protein
MSSTAIRVENLSKLYRLGEVGTGSLAHDINRWWHRISGKEDPYSQVGQVNDRTKKAESEYVWALKDINFEVKQGEVVGIIGRNGAGKSTLLKILSRITSPTSGDVKVKGRIASLLEVGTGFNPELTGKENIYLNGAILGMRKKEIDGKLDQIVEFSGCEAYLDTPVKRYSSGMQVRLAFAVAAHLDPEILIVDEVLAVGDISFQRKCLGRMQDVAAEGRTVLFVSHNMQSISTLTRKSFYLKNGSIAFEGTTSEAIRHYMDEGACKAASYRVEPSGEVPQIIAVELVTSHPGQIHYHGQSMTISVEVFTPVPMNAAAFSLCIVDGHDEKIVHAWLYDDEQPLLMQPGVHRLTCAFPVLRLHKGNYSVTAYLSEGGEGGRHWQTLDRACHFEVVMFGMSRSWSWSEHECKYLEDWKWQQELIDSGKIGSSSANGVPHENSSIL